MSARGEYMLMKLMKHKNKTKQKLLCEYMGPTSFCNIHILLILLFPCFPPSIALSYAP